MFFNRGFLVKFSFGLVFIAFTALLLLNISCGRQGSDNSRKPGVSVTDDLNRTVGFTSVPKRVICLAPNLTEMIYTLGVQSSLAGNTLYCNYPPEARKITKVGDMMTLDFERILSLKPDLVFITVEGNSRDSYNKLLSLGLKVFVSNPRNFQGIKKTFMDMGRIYNDTLKARSFVQQWEAKFRDVAHKAEKMPRKTAMFLVGLNPLMLAGKNTFINELVTSAGLINIAADSPLNYPVYSREEILKRDPDYIISTDNTPDIYKKLIESYPEWRSLKALKEHNVVTGDPDLYLRPGPRFADAVADLFNKLHYRGN